MLAGYKLRISNQQKYFALIGFVLSNYKKTLRLISRSIENNNLRIILENTLTENIAFIYIRSISFYHTAEILTIIERKLKKIL